MEMKPTLSLLLLVIHIMVLASCTPLAYENDTETYEPIEMPDIDGITEYRPADVSNVMIEGSEINLPQSISTLSDEMLLLRILPTITEFIDDGYLGAFMDSLAPIIEDLDPGYNIKPKSVEASAELHIRNEGVEFWTGMEEASAFIEYLDLEADAKGLDLAAFIMNALASSAYPDQSLDGNMASSGYFRITDSKDGDVPQLDISYYLTLNAIGLELSSLKAGSGENIHELYIPDKGLLKTGGVLSIASSLITIEKEQEGLERKYINCYCPVFISLSVRPTNEFDASALFKAISDMINTGSELTAEAIYMTIAGIIWDSPSGNLVLDIHIPDTGDGSSRDISYSDWSILQFFF